jgi:hypothetical protein
MRRQGRSRRNRRVVNPGRDLKSVNAVVRVRLATVITISSDSKAVVAGFIPCDPSSSGLNISEYSSWSSLYNQVRLLGMSVRFMKISVYSPNFTTGALAIASTLDAVGTPSSRGAVLDNADSILWNWVSDTSPSGFRHSLRMSTQPTWASSSSPNPGDNVGCPGGIIYYGLDIPSSVGGAVAMFDVYVEGFYAFRSRA